MQPKQLTGYPPQYQFQFQQLLLQAQQKISHTITTLQSDQVLQQMRNDKTLYQYKLKHIKQIIQEHFQFEKEIMDLMAENERLRESLGVLNERIVAKEREFGEAIDLIEDSARRHMRSKEEEISRLNGTIKELEDRLVSTSSTKQTSQKKSQQLTQTLQSLQSELQKSQQQCKALSQSVKKHKSTQKQLESEHEKAISILKSEFQKQSQQYENIIKRMQNDMLVIRNQWEKKCREVERGLREFYQAEILKLEERKSRELIEHISSVKEGKPVIIKQDEEIINSRIQSIRHQYQGQLQTLQSSYNQLQHLHQTLQSSQLPKTKQLNTLSQSLRTLQSQLHQQRQSFQSQKQKSKKELQKLRNAILEFERSEKDAVLVMEQKDMEIVKLADNVRFLEKKLEVVTRGLGEQKEVVVTKEEEIQGIKSKYVGLEDNYKKIKKTFDHLQSQLENKNKKIQSLTKQIDLFNEKIAQFQEAQSLLKSQIKNLKQNKQKYRKAFDKIYLQLKQTQKQITLMKEDIKYIYQLNKKRNISQFQKLIDQIQIFKQNAQKSSREKMNQLINQIQQAKQAQHAQFQTVLRQRQNLKRQVAELEDLFTRKQKQVQQTKRIVLNAQAQQMKRLMVDQIHRQKQKYQRLQQQFINNQKQFHKRLQKTKGEVKDAVKVLAGKWMEQITRLQEDNKRKQLQMQKIVDKVSVIVSQNQQSKNKYQSQRQQAKRFKKKYETLKQQKDEQITQLIKRLERQSKHKITLQKQLRSIRSQLNRGVKLNKQTTQRQNRGIGNTIATDRQKQITEIRQLIAKTYQFVGQKPEKDTRIDRKRSPY